MFVWIAIAILVLIVLFVYFVYRGRKMKRVGRRFSALRDTAYGRMMRNRVEPARQGPCNSCWAIATAQAMSDRLRHRGEIDIDEELNYYLFHDVVIGRTPEADGCVEGAYIDTGMNKSVEMGIPLMDTTSDRSFDEEYSQADLQASRIRAKYWRKVPPSQIKDELEENGTVVTLINLYDSFGDFAGNGAYSPRSYEHADPGMVHMVTIVGYDDRDNTWIVRNSYGPSWGYHGYFKIRQGDQTMLADDYVYAPEF